MDALPAQPDLTTFPQPRHIPTRGYNITQSSAPDDRHMVARNMLSNYYKRNKEYKKWHLVDFSYPRWLIYLYLRLYEYLFAILLSIKYKSAKNCTDCFSFMTKLRVSMNKFSHSVSIQNCPNQIKNEYFVDLHSVHYDMLLIINPKMFTFYTVIPRLTSDPANEFFG